LTRYCSPVSSNQRERTLLRSSERRADFLILPMECCRPHACHRDGSIANTFLSSMAHSRQSRKKRGDLFGPLRKEVKKALALENCPSIACNALVYVK